MGYPWLSQLKLGQQYDYSYEDEMAEEYPTKEEIADAVIAKLRVASPDLWDLLEYYDIKDSRFYYSLCPGYSPLPLALEWKLTQQTIEISIVDKSTSKVMWSTTLANNGKLDP